MPCVVKSYLRQAHVCHYTFEVMIHGACRNRSAILSRKNKIVPVWITRTTPQSLLCLNNFCLIQHSNDLWSYNKCPFLIVLQRCKIIFAQARTIIYAGILSIDPDGWRGEINTIPRQTNNLTFSQTRKECNEEHRIKILIIQLCSLKKFMHLYVR